MKLLRASKPGVRPSFLTASLALVAATMAYSSSSLAGDSSSGCGVGWMILKKNSLVSSSLRASTNATFFNTVAMTFGTSGCARHSIVKRDSIDEYYAEANFDNIVVEMAQGQGESIAVFSQVLGCDPVVTPYFNQIMQNNYDQILPSHETQPMEMLRGVKETLKSDPILSQSCQAA